MAPASRSYLRLLDGKMARDRAAARSSDLPRQNRRAVASWTALLAATSLGVPIASKVHAQVRADTALSEGRSYRLVVQSYDPADREAALRGRAKPIGSVQRAVTADEMREGVSVDLLELRQTDSVRDDAARGNLAKALVLAWVEEGKPDLELDARRARPLPGSLVGAAPREPSQDSVTISVKPA